MFGFVINLATLCVLKIAKLYVFDSIGYMAKTVPHAIGMKKGQVLLFSAVQVKDIKLVYGPAGILKIIKESDLHEC